jgi:hypothetical protein
MPTTASSVNYTKEVALATTGASNRIGMGRVDAPVLCLEDSIELASQGATATLTFASLPLGARIVGVTMAWDDLQDSNTISLGVTGATTLFYTTVDASAVGSSNAIPVDAVGYVTTATTLNLIATTSAHEATGTIKIVVLYTMSSTGA